MAGPIVDDTLVAAPRQRNADAQKAWIGAGGTAARIRPEKPAKGRRKDVGARWTVQFSKARPAADGKPRIDSAIPACGYRNQGRGPTDTINQFVSQGAQGDRQGAHLRRSAARHPPAGAGHRRGGARPREGLIDQNDTASDVRADSACRSAENERFLAGTGKVDRIHRREPKGRPMPRPTARANAARSQVRALLEHPFARRKRVRGRVIRTVAPARAAAAVTFANMACEAMVPARQAGLPA